MKRLIVATDGSSYGAEACKYACWLARRTDAEILAVYVSDIRQYEIPMVADLSGSFGFQPYQGISEQLRSIEEEKAEAIGKATMAILDAEGMSARSRLEHHSGLPVEILKDLQEADDLIVLGKRGETADFQSEHLGTTMERVVRSSPGPVWVTSRKFREIRRVVFAYDAGPSCRKALRFLETTDTLRGLELHVVTVAEGQQEGTQLNQELREAEKRLRAADYEPVCQMLTGEPENTIAGYVQEREMDMLIMGAYGHSRIRYLLIGSTTTEMLRRCMIPVLCFR